MATKKKYTIDDYKDRLDSPLGVTLLPSKKTGKKTVKKSGSKKRKSNAKGK